MRVDIFMNNAFILLIATDGAQRDVVTLTLMINETKTVTVFLK